MAYDSLIQKGDSYIKNKTQLDGEFEIFSIDAKRVEDVVTDSVELDDDVRDSLLGIQREFDVEQNSFNEKKSELEAEKNEISETINAELKKLNKAEEKLDSLAGKKYTGGLERVSQKCKECIEQLNEMLDRMGALADASSGSDFVNPVASSAGSDTGILQRLQADHYSPQMFNYPRIVGEHSIEDDLRAVNPNFTEDPNSPWHNNCQRCVMVYEARRRGYDVEAQMLPSDNDSLLYMNPPDGWPYVYKNPDVVDCSANSGTQAMGNVIDQMVEWGDNARGIVRVRFVGGGGHVFIAERVNGKSRFVDPQTGSEDVTDYFYSVVGSGVACMRTDNLEFSDLIHRCCQPRK